MRSSLAPAAALVAASALAGYAAVALLLRVTLAPLACPAGSPEASLAPADRAPPLVASIPRAPLAPARPLARRSLASAPRATPDPAGALAIRPGQLVVLDFAAAGVRALWLREGAVEHLERADWARYAHNRRLRLLHAEPHARGPRVRLLAVGVGSDGAPAVALVRDVKSGLRGVVCLRPDGARIALRPARQVAAARP